MSERMEDPDDRNSRGQQSRVPDTPGMGRRVMSVRVPLWSALAMVIVVAGLFAVMLFSRDSVDLGEAVDGATEASVTLTICNETVDRRGINPRDAELEFQQGLEDLGANQADVKVNRIDCGADTDAPEN